MNAPPSHGKVALVTGAGRYRGIGRAIALRLAHDGLDVVVSAIHRPAASLPIHEQQAGWTGAASLAGEIGATGRRSLAFDCDVAVADDVEAMIEGTIAEFGRLDVLVNNAALPSDAGAAPLLDMDDDVWFRTVDVNLNGLYLVTKFAGRAMRAAGHGGSIVNISSMAGRQGLPNYGAYCATKWAMIGLTQQLAMELVGDGIRVNCVCPGSTDTDMMDGTFGRSAARLGVAAEMARRGTVSRIPMGRQGYVSEQAAAVSFLASDDASYITGQTLNVDGGLRMD
jgi:NAD(P)-dependent dehydrogenase (short-subunit alcohol dehydrogenase family)